ncbi:hypothetical protein K435DRAFT_866880 [Dendrothele bispora CBS 962.96]|uniref:Uncharacterized protein n=1 Tax=Dendrothele bispora (strain CBS 962.96) TaxID=1314807 RepID=A0A4S8LG37_DENBC|nr:hypothetical protein K435DRAFT_866880 [Dendrothele bispora CBS 962.96]
MTNLVQNDNGHWLKQRTGYEATARGALPGRKQERNPREGRRERLSVRGRARDKRTGRTTCSGTVPPNPVDETERGRRNPTLMAEEHGRSITGSTAAGSLRLGDPSTAPVLLLGVVGPSRQPGPVCSTYACTSLGRQGSRIGYLGLATRWAIAEGGVRIADGW